MEQWTENPINTLSPLFTKFTWQEITSILESQLTLDTWLLLEICPALEVLQCRVGQKTGLFLSIDNLATVCGRKPVLCVKNLRFTQIRQRIFKHAYMQVIHFSKQNSKSFDTLLLTVAKPSMLKNSSFFGLLYFQQDHCEIQNLVLYLMTHTNHESYRHQLSVIMCINSQFSCTVFGPDNVDN